MEVIAGGFAGGGSSNNAHKRHLREVLTVENKKVRPKRISVRAIISFLNDDYLEGFDWQHDDLMVITATIHNYLVKQILVDQGSSTDILYSDTITSIGIRKANLKPHEGSLIGFSGKHVPVEGLIRLRVTLGTWPAVVDVDVNFFVVDTSNMAYNAIMGRMSLNRLQAIVSTPHLLMKFPTPKGIGQVQVDQVATRRCYMASLKGKQEG